MAITTLAKKTHRFWQTKLIASPWCIPEPKTCQAFQWRKCVITWGRWRQLQLYRKGHAWCALYERSSNEKSGMRRRILGTQIKELVACVTGPDPAWPEPIRVRGAMSWHGLGSGQVREVWMLFELWSLPKGIGALSGKEIALAYIWVWLWACFRVNNAIECICAIVII